MSAQLPICIDSFTPVERFPSPPALLLAQTDLLDGLEPLPIPYALEDVKSIRQFSGGPQRAQRNGRNLRTQPYIGSGSSLQSVRLISLASSPSLHSQSAELGTESISQARPHRAITPLTSPHPASSSVSRATSEPRITVRSGLSNASRVASPSALSSRAKSVPLRTSTSPEPQPDKHVSFESDELYIPPVLRVLPNGTYAKPKGEAGRPGRGGYRLDAELLKWSQRDFEHAQQTVKELAALMLDTASSLSDQDSGAVSKFIDRATATIPAFDNFDRFWPLLELLRLHLKYTASQARKKNEKAAAEVAEVEAEVAAAAAAAAVKSAAKVAARSTRSKKKK